MISPLEREVVTVAERRADRRAELVRVVPTLALLYVCGAVLLIQCSILVAGLAAWLAS